MMQVWDTREDLERFNREVDFPAIDGPGGDGFPKAPIVRDVITVDAWIGAEMLT
ncbi:hypothetical protein ACQE98_17440 [Ornithinimicrobium sp. W1679]|uniref:hypothetical protein n=1 Tax=Ornithinimicrobium sp. W1679 TaxID=3418770 RepID=UPI003CF821A6